MRMREASVPSPHFSRGVCGVVARVVEEQWLKGVPAILAALLFLLGLHRFLLATPINLGLAGRFLHVLSACVIFGEYPEF